MKKSSTKAIVPQLAGLEAHVCLMGLYQNLRENEPLFISPGESSPVFDVYALRDV